MNRVNNFDRHWRHFYASGDGRAGGADGSRFDDDQVRRELLQSDFMGPIIRSLEVANNERREAEAREQTRMTTSLALDILCLP